MNHVWLPLPESCILEQLSNISEFEFVLSFAPWIGPLHYVNTFFMHFIFHFQKIILWNNQFNNYFIMAVKLKKHEGYLLAVSRISFGFFFPLFFYPISIFGKKYFQFRVGEWLRLISCRLFSPLFPIYQSQINTLGALQPAWLHIDPGQLVYSVLASCWCTSPWG